MSYQNKGAIDDKMQSLLPALVYSVDVAWIIFIRRQHAASPVHWSRWPTPVSQSRSTVNHVTMIHVSISRQAFLS